MKGQLKKFKCDTKIGVPVYVFSSDKVGASFKCALQYGSCLSVVEVTEKQFDITQHELNDHLTELESGNLGVNDCGWIIDKERAIAIAKALGVTAEDLK